MVKILIIAGFGKSLLNFRSELINSWVAAGYRVLAAAPGWEAEAELKQKGVCYESIPLKRASLNPVKDLLLLLHLIRFYKRTRPDYLFLYTAKPVIYGSLAAVFSRRCRVFSMVTGLGFVFTEENKALWLRWLTVWLYRVALKRNEKVFFQNPDDRNLFVRLKIIEATMTILVSGSGVNLEYYKQVALPSGPPVFLIIARLLKEKGFIEFVEAARLVKCKHPVAQFKMIAWQLEGGPSVISDEQIRQWREEGVVEIFGETDNVRPFLADACVYVLPSYREGTPRTVLEAMAVGRAIITTDAPGCRETVVEGVNGFLVPVRDSRALAAAMERFIAEPELIVQMGKASRRIAEEKYDVHKVNQVINKSMGLL
jgi:glycosyltransferase involved in cell wall biosynthesis